MVLQQDKERQHIINQVCEQLKKRVPDNQYNLMKVFVNRYYAASSIEDLSQRSIEDLTGALISHWNFIYQRAPGESKVRVFNPTLERDQWQSTHTIIEVSHDDYPFLVDSIRMEVNRCGYQIHFAIHFGGLRLKRDTENRIVDILPIGDKNPDSISEAPIYVEIDRQVDPEVMQTLQTNIERVLGDVRISVLDWRKND